jgi:hypothetical protein
MIQIAQKRSGTSRAARAPLRLQTGRDLVIVREKSGHGADVAFRQILLKSYIVSFRGSPTERISAHVVDEVKGLDNALTTPSILFGQDIRVWRFRTGRAKVFSAIFSWHAVGAKKT